MKNIKYSNIRQKIEYEPESNLDLSKKNSKMKNDSRILARELENFAEDKVKYISNVSNASYDTQYLKTKLSIPQGKNYQKSTSNESLANPKAYKVVNFMQTGNSLEKGVIQGLEDEDERRIILYKIGCLEKEISNLKSRLTYYEEPNNETQYSGCHHIANEQQTINPQVQFLSLKDNTKLEDENIWLSQKLEGCINEITTLKVKLDETKYIMSNQLEEVRRISYFEIDDIHTKYHHTLKAYETQLERLSNENAILKSKLGKVQGILNGPSN